uniref:hypothetical protein n=1 Tax=Photorhabdus sp. RM322S TaxID=3342825 RepID=UPI0036DB4507
MTSNSDGYIAFLKPGSNEWIPLSNESFVFWRDRNKNLALEMTGIDLKTVESEPIADSEKEIIRENRGYFNDVLLRSLQLPNLSFFAGSGTSLGEVGGPSMLDLWINSMWENPLLNKEEVGYGILKESAIKICERVRYNEIKYPNIEHFLSQCDAYLSFHDDAEVLNFLNDVKAVILDKCQSFINARTSDLTSYKMLLQKMARRRVRDPCLKVFTTNYDMTFETSASDLGMIVVDGLSYTGKRRFDGKYFNYVNLPLVFKLTPIIIWSRLGFRISSVNFLTYSDAFANRKNTINQLSSNTVLIISGIIMSRKFLGQMLMYQDSVNLMLDNIYVTDSNQSVNSLKNIIINNRCSVNYASVGVFEIYVQRYDLI